MKLAPIVLTAAATVAMSAHTAWAGASAPCAPRERIVAQLEKKYGETRRGVGLQNKGSVTEIYASEKTGTWTIVVTKPDGTACAVAAGEAWLDDVAELDTPV
jgi:hypothetical protein